MWKRASSLSLSFRSDFFFILSFSPHLFSFSLSLSLAPKIGIISLSLPFLLHPLTPTACALKKQKQSKAKRR